jgi:hypothetical protein
MYNNGKKYALLFDALHDFTWSTWFCHYCICTGSVANAQEFGQMKNKMAASG